MTGSCPSIETNLKAITEPRFPDASGLAWVVQSRERHELKLILNQVIPMNQLMSITWAQSILIEAGAVLQIIAIVALIRQRLSNRMLPMIGEEMPGEDEDENEESNFSKYESPVNQNWAPVSPRRQGGPIKVTLPAKTTKVKFKQSFKFRE